MSQSEPTEISEQYLSEEEWNELARKVEDEVKQKGVLKFPDYKDDQLRNFICQVTSKDDFYSFYRVIGGLLQDGSLPSNEIQWKGLAAMAAACSGEEEEACRLAKEVYTEEPRFGLAYATVAHILYNSDLSFAALPWLKLADLAQDCTSSNWYNRLRDAIEFEVERLTRLQKTMEPIFTDDAKFDYLLRLYEVKEDEELYSIFQKVRENPGKMNELRQAYPALYQWFNTVLRDPIPAIIHYRPDPPAYVPPSDGKVTRLDQLPPSVAASIVVNLTEPALFNLLVTNEATNALFDHPEVWKALIERDAMSVDTIRGPFESFEWKHIFRMFNFVVFSSSVIARLRPNVSAGSRDYVLIKPKDVAELWSMCDRFQIHSFTTRHSVFSVVLDFASELLSLDGSQDRRLFFVFGEFLFLKHMAISAVIPQPRAKAAATSAANFLSGFIPSPLPKSSSTFLDRDHSISLRTAVKVGDYTPLPALNNLYFFKNFDPTFKFHPICPSGRSVAFRRRLPSSLKQNNADTPIKSEESSENEKDSKPNFQVSESFAFATSKDVGGVYRLFLRYLNLDLSDQQDTGVAMLVFDRKTTKLEGYGRDTLRGPFTIKSGFSSNECQARIDSCAKNRDGIVIMPQHLILSYQDGTRLYLRASPFTYGFSGEFEYLSDSEDVFERIESGTLELPSAGEDDVTIVTGGFTLLYDIEATKSVQESNSSPSTSSVRKESQFDKLMNQNELDEVKKRKERASNPNFANMKPYFEPWNYESPHPERLRLRNAILHFSSIQFDLWTEAAAVMKVIDWSRRMPRMSQEALARTQGLSNSLLAPQTAYESDIKYAQRSSVLRTCVAVLLELRAALVAEFPPERIAAAVNELSSPRSPHRDAEYAFWSELLFMIPTESPYQFDLLKQQLSAFQNAVDVSPNAGINVRDKLGHVVSKKTPKIYLNPVLLTTLVSVGIAAVGIGAFFVGRVLSKRND